MMVLQFGHYTATSGSVHSRMLSILLVVIWLLAFLTACSDDDDSSADAAAPTAEIHFPGYYGLTEGDTVLVTGAAADANTITRVRVAGVDATSTDGFATWRATVALEPGDNVIEVETTDEFSNIDAAAATLQVKSSAYLRNPTAIALDSAHGRLLAIDGDAKSVMAVDMDTGTPTVLSGSAIPDANNLLSGPSDITVDTANNRALVVDGRAIVAVDLETGARSILSSNTIPDANNPLEGPSDIAVDAANNRALAVDGTAVVAVDLDTGARSILSSNTIPDTNTIFRRPAAITLDGANNRALVVDGNYGGPAAVIAVDLDSGARAILSDSTIPETSIALLIATSIAVDAAHDRALVANASGMIQVDLSTGARSIFLPEQNYTRPGRNNLVIDAANNRVLAIEDNSKTIVALNLDTGARSVVPTADSPDSSNPLGVPGRIALDTRHRRALVVDSFLRAVVAVDLDTGARSILSDRGTPDSINSFHSPIGITLDTNNNRALVAESSLNAVIAVDLDNGARTMLSHGPLPPSDAYVSLRDITLDQANNRALVATAYVSITPAAISVMPSETITYGYSSVMSVDLDSGARTILSDNTSPDDSNLLSQPYGIALDSANDRALLIDAGFQEEALLAVDLNSGARTVLSNSEIPDSSNAFSFPAAIALDSRNNRALVVDWSPPNVFGISSSSITSVDLASGARTILSDETTPDGNNLLATSAGIALDVARNRALVVDRQLKAVIAIELTSGERVIVSK